MFEYHFRKNGERLGDLVLENDTKAFSMGRALGATFIRNIDTRDAFSKCSHCGTWEKIERLNEHLCPWCSYIQGIQKWLNFYEEELSKHFDGDIDNYGEEFKITFKGQTLTLDFGPDEDGYFINGIRELLKYYNKEQEEFRALEEGQK